MKKLLSRQNLPEIIVGFSLILLIFIPRTINLGLFQAHDETMRNRQSLDSFQAIAEGRWGDVYSSNFGATNLTWARTVAKLLQYGWLRAQGVEVSLADMANYGPKFDPLPAAVFNALLVIVAYWFIRKLFDRRVALVGTALLALDAYLLSEARILRTESAFATFFTLVIICAALYYQTRQRRYLVWTGIWTGWTIAVKISGVILAPILLCILLITAWKITPSFKSPGQFLKRFSVDVFIWLAVSIGCIFAIWPTLWVKPLQTFIDLYQLVYFFGVVSKENLDFFYLGQVVPELPALYYGLVLLYKTTPLVWLGMGLFIWAVWPANRVKATPSNLSAGLSSGLIILIAGVIYTIGMMVALFKTERYMMVTVSLMDVVAAVGLVIGGGYIYRRWQAGLLPAWGFWLGAVFIFLAGHGIFAWLNFPYYFSYHNPLLGGGATAAKLIQIGSGEGLDLAVNYLAHKPDPAQQVVVCGTNLPRCEYLSAGQTWLERDALNPLYSDWVAADYVITYIFQSQRGDYPPGVIDYLEHHPGPEYTATIQGIEYSKVYPAPHAQYVAASTLTGISALLGYNLSRQQLHAGEELQIKLYLQNDGRIEHDLFVQLVDSDDYIWGNTTAAILPNFEHLIDQRGAVLEAQAALPTPIGMPPGRYYLKMGYKNNTGQLIGRFELPHQGDFVDLTLPSSFTARPTPAYPLQLNIGPALELAGYNLEPSTAQPGEPVWLTLFWQAHADVAKDYVINVRLLDKTGQEAVYWLGRPVRSGYPTTEWRTGQVVQDPWRLQIPAEIRPGGYSFEIVIFDAATGAEVKRQRLIQVKMGG